MTSQYITYEDYNMAVSERKLVHNTLCTNRLFGGGKFSPHIQRGIFHK